MITKADYLKHRIREVNKNAYKLERHEAVRMIELNSSFLHMNYLTQEEEKALNEIYDRIFG